MRFYNQTARALRWDMSGEIYECEPWGSVEVDPSLEVAVRSRGLPLERTRVPPEIRAQERIATEQKAADEAPLKALKEAAERAQAQELETKRELERTQVELSEANQKLNAMGKALDELKAAYDRLASDKEATEKMLSEAAQKAAESEERALKAEALQLAAQPPAQQDSGKKSAPK